MKIELIDLRRVVGLSQFLQTNRAERGYAEHRPVLRSGRSHGALTLIMKQALQRGRRAIKRRRQFLAHDDYGHIDRFHPAQDIRHQIAALETCGIPAKRYLVIRRPVDVIEDRARQPTPRELTEIMEIMTVTHAHPELRTSIGSRAPKAATALVYRKHGNDIGTRYLDIEANKARRAPLPTLQCQTSW